MDKLGHKAGSRTRGRVLRVLVAGAAVAVSLVLGGTAEAASPHSSGCTGTNSSVGSVYEFAGSGYQQGASYKVTITMPNGSSFIGVATADASGNWGQYWYGNMAGTYVATVAAYHSGMAVGSCSLVVS